MLKLEARVEYKNPSGSRDYYVVFDRLRGEKRFWNIFTGKTYAHVWALTPLCNNLTLVIKPFPSGCQIEEWPCNIKQAIDLIPQDTTSVLKYTVEYGNLSHYRFYSVMSCVSYLKYLLGVRGFFIATPLSLYKKLVHLGAREIRRRSYFDS